MAIDLFLAMTGAEIRANTALPERIGWMACHFSPYGTGLTNLPPHLPESAMLILNDRTPIHGHDPQRIIGQLREILETLKCGSILLDFQRPGEAETAVLAAEIVHALPCPTAVSEMYAEGIPCPIFLPPAPPDVMLRDYLAPQKGREVWLDTALDGKIITLTEDGALSSPLFRENVPEDGHREERLRCHYTMQTGEEQAKFTLFRTEEDLRDLLEDAEALGVSRAVGLWQELRWM